MLNQHDKNVLIRLIDNKLLDLESKNAPIDNIAYMYELMDKVDMLNV